MFGTIMTANVWMRILPVQRRMVGGPESRKEPDQAEAARAKASSKHNTFLVVPVVFMMISNHFPSITYGRSDNWLIPLGPGAARMGGANYCAAPEKENHHWLSTPLTCIRSP